MKTTKQRIEQQIELLNKLKAFVTDLLSLNREDLIAKVNTGEIWGRVSTEYNKTIIYTLSCLALVDSYGDMLSTELIKMNLTEVIPNLDKEIHIQEEDLSKNEE
jgi:hypothetical protein